MPRQHAWARRRHTVVEHDESEDDASPGSEWSDESSRRSDDSEHPPRTHRQASKKRRGGSGRGRTAKRRKAKSRRRSAGCGTALDLGDASSVSSDDAEAVDTAQADAEEAELEVLPRDELVHVPQLDVKQFADWDEFDAYLRSYSKRTFQLYAIRTATPVRRRNAVILNSRASAKVIPEDFKFYNKTYVCTHHGTPRTGRGRGSRPNQHSRKIGCPAQINLCVKETGGWGVCLTKQITGHNHDISREIYQNYHELRQVSDEDVLETVRTLHRAGANRKRILEFITENSSAEPHMKDVHNLVARLQKEAYDYPTMEERIRAILEDFAAKVGNTTRVYTNDEDVVECISIQSSHMRTMFEHFPEILLIDATHDTNASHYKLFSFMVHDAMGKGQHVQHCLLENERKETLRVACRQFKESCPTYDSLAVIMIDKDFTELAVLEEEFPGARILLCHFHVVKYLQEEVAKERYNLDAWTKKEMKRLITLLVSAPTEKSYDDVIETMKVVLRTEIKVRLWFDYFDRNWTECKTRWSSIYRGNVPHMGNQTNNRLESSWQKLKTLVNKSTTLDDCVVAILFWQTVNEKLWARSMKKIGVFMNNEYDAEINTLLNTVSKHAVELIKQQYDFALLPSTEYRDYPLGPYVMMQYTAGKEEDTPEEYMLNPDSWLSGAGDDHSPALVSEDLPELRRDSTGEVDVPYEDRVMRSDGGLRPKERNDKFNHLLALGRQIADVGASWGSDAHCELQNLLAKILTHCRRGKCPRIMLAEEDTTLRASESTEEKQGSSLDESDPEEDLPSDLESHALSPPPTIRNDERKDEEAPLSPMGRAVYGLVKDFVDKSIDSPHQSVHDDVNALEGPRRLETVEHSETGTQSQTVLNVDEDPRESHGAGSADNTPRPRDAPQWSIAKSKKRAGRAREAKVARKQAASEGLRQTTRLVHAVAEGSTPSMVTVVEAHKNGFKLRDAQALEAISVLNQTRSTKITVFEKVRVPPTEPFEIMAVLPTQRIESCKSQVALFQNRWFSDRERRIATWAVSVKVGRVVYSVEMLTAMQRWHVAMDRFPEAKKTIKWVSKVSLLAPDPEVDPWRDDCLSKDEVMERLKDLDVLGDFYWLTTLRSREPVELSCMDLCLRGLIHFYREEIAVFTIPSHVLQFPNFDKDTIEAEPVWSELRSAARRMGLSGEERGEDEPADGRDNLWFLAVIHFGTNHWCSVAVDFAERSISVYDPQKTGDRFQALRTYLYNELLPLLPSLPSPRRFHFKQVDWTPQIDNYNCGVFVLLFFELVLNHGRLTGLEADTTAAMQFFRL